MRDRLSVFGIDIIKGSVRSRTRRPVYALVRMEGQTIVSESEVSLFRLFRMLTGGTTRYPCRGQPAGDRR